MKNNNKCKNCKFLEYQYWYDPNVEVKEKQGGGLCKLLYKVLSMSNKLSYDQNNLYVYESFGCNLFRNKYD